MTTLETPAPRAPVRVLHYARTVLAKTTLRECFEAADVDFLSVEDFDIFLSEISRSDLILLADPGHERATAIKAAIASTPERPMGVHILSAGRDSFDDWQPPPHVVVSGAGSALASTVAEHALALMLALRRGIHRFIAANPRWLPDGEAGHFLRTLEGAHLLIVGCGRIGCEIAQRARPFGIRITGVNRSRIDDPVFDTVVSLDGLDTVLPEADLLVLCLPLTGSTQGLIGRDRLRRFRPGSILINVGRGGLVDEDALAEALAGGSLGGAGLDVFAEEPLPPSHPLWRTPNTILTPHIAGLGGPGETAIAASAGRALAALLSRRSPARP